MSSPTGRRISFGRHSLEPATCRLWTGEAEVRLTRKSAEVLCLLVERAGQPVSKEDLFALVWSGTVVSDDALTTCIQELRKVLGDDARKPRYIETRHRYGYRVLGSAGARHRRTWPCSNRRLAFHGHESGTGPELLLRGCGRGVDRCPQRSGGAARLMPQLFLQVS